MALSGSFSQMPINIFGLYCTWSATQSVVGNYSDVTLNVYLKYYSLYVGARSDSTISINGTSETYTAAAISQSSNTAHTTLLKSKTVRVYHDSNGKKTNVVLSTSWRFDGTYSGAEISTITASTTIDLDPLDRTAPTVSFSYSNVATNSLNIAVSASTTCDIWQYSTNGGTSWNTFNSTAGTSKTHTITGLAANTSYSVKVRARKSSNQVYGTSGASTIKTLGAAVINSINTVTADNGTVTIVFNRTIFSASFSHTLKIKKGSTVILTITGLTGSAGTGSQTITLTATQRTTLLNAMSSIKSFTATFELITYNGTTQVGSTSSKNATIQTTAANSAPVFSNTAGFTFLDYYTTTTATTGNNQILIKNYSKLRITAYPGTAKNGASISSYEATIAGTTITSTGTTLTVGIIPESGTITATVKITDSRGYTVTKSKTITVVDYTPISITDYMLRRINEVNAMTELEISGTLSTINVSNVNKNSFQSLKYRYKKTSEDTWSGYTSITTTSTTTSFSFSDDEWVSFNADYSYNIEIIARDKLTSYTISVILSQGTPLITLRRKKVGINNRNPQAAIDVIGNVVMNGFNVMGFLQSLGSTEDLNNLVENGIYTQSANANATTAKHYPVAYAGFLEVIENSSGFIMQRYTTYNNTGMYTRTRCNGYWCAWKNYG